MGSKLGYGSIIFDKVGVLVDTEEAKTRSYFQALSKFMPNPPDWAKYREWHTRELTGKSRSEVLESITAAFPPVRRRLRLPKDVERAWLSGRFRSEKYEEVQNTLDRVMKEFGNLESIPPQQILSVQRFIEYAELRPREKCRPIAHVIAFCRRLQRAGIPTALVTESQFARTERELSNIGLKVANFDIVACADSVFAHGRFRRSPGNKAQMYRLVGNRFRRNHWPCVAIEDTTKGVAAAVQGGVPALLLSSVTSPDTALGLLQALSVELVLQSV